MTDLCTSCGKPTDPHPYRHPITRESDAEKLERLNADSLLALRLTMVLHRIHGGYTREDVARSLGWTMAEVRAFEERFDSQVRLSQLRRYALTIGVSYSLDVEVVQPTEEQDT